MTRRLLASAFLIWVTASQTVYAETAVLLPDQEPARLEFMAAMQRVRNHQPEASDSPALDAYILHDYLVAARLRQALETDATAALDDTIDAFLHAHGGQPVGRGLKHEWLLSLANRARWDWFLPRAAESTDPQLACDRLAGKMATGDTALLAREALERWSLPQRQPSECNTVFAWLRAQGLITPALAEDRTRAALAADNVHLAAEFVADVPAPQSGPLLQWIQLLEAPKAPLALLSLDPAMPVEADALAAGFTHLSNGDSAAALRLLPALLNRPDVTGALRTRLQRAAALGAAYSRTPGAVEAFSVLPFDPNDVAVQEWRVRAALWAGDNVTALKWLDTMPAALATQPRWRYWRARVIGILQGTEPAAPLYAGIAGTRDYYGYLAADRLNQGYNLNIHPSPDDADVQAALDAEPGVMRAHALFECDMVDDAGIEWAVAMSNEKPAVKIQAAHLASRWGWYAETIATLAQAGEWDDVALRYPRPYAAEVAAASKQTEVPGDWIFGIMRQESLFRKDAVSRADARGLMQMQPATALAVAHRWHLMPPTRQSLFDPTVAIPLGAIYVRELLDKYGGQLDQTLAAYNAGPMAVARWLPPTSMDADIWIENIPYTETRGYIQHILEHIVAFAAMRGATPPRLAALLPRIERTPP